MSWSRRPAPIARRSRRREARSEPAERGEPDARRGDIRDEGDRRRAARGGEPEGDTTAGDREADDADVGGDVAVRACAGGGGLAGGVAGFAAAAAGPAVPLVELFLVETPAVEGQADAGAERGAPRDGDDLADAAARAGDGDRAGEGGDDDVAMLALGDDDGLAVRQAI